MNVTFNPSVNFKSDTNLIAEAARRMKQEQGEQKRIVSHIPADSYEVRFPDSWETQTEHTARIKNEQDVMKNRLDSLNQALKDGEKVETMLQSKYWEKEYIPDDFGRGKVFAQMPNTSDGLTYTIYDNGKVVTTSGIAGTQKVIKESDKELAKYVAEMKAEYENAMHKGLDQKFETEQVKPKSNVYTSKEYTQAELDEKADTFAQNLSNRQWKKEYLPENDIIIVRQKRVKDGLEYMIKNDGTVMETGLRDKAIVIIEPNSESAKTFAKYKKKLDPNAPKTSLWLKAKEAVAGVWKFFTVAGTMGVATAKGLWQGALASAAVLATAVIVKGATAVIKNEKTISDIAKAPLKTAGGLGKVIAFAVGAIVLAGHLIAGKLEANQKSAVIEHKIDVPHID